MPPPVDPSANCSISMTPSLKLWDFPHITRETHRRKAPNIKSLAVLLDVSDNRERRRVATKMHLINTARATFSHLVIVAHSIRGHANEREKEEKRNNNEGGKEGIKKPRKR